MSIENDPAASLEAFRGRHRAFVEARDHLTPQPDDFEIDVDDLIGAKGTKLEVTAEELASAKTHWLPDPEYWTKNMTLTLNNSVFPDDIASYDGDPEGLRDATAQILSRLAARKAIEAVEPLKQAVAELREPLRTVAVNHLYFNGDLDVLARYLGTSIETIEFLTELALDQLALHITIT